MQKATIIVLFQPHHSELVHPSHAAGGSSLAAGPPPSHLPAWLAAPLAAYRRRPGLSSAPSSGWKRLSPAGSASNMRSAGRSGGPTTRPASCGQASVQLAVKPSLSSPLVVLEYVNTSGVTVIAWHFKIKASFQNEFMFNCWWNQSLHVWLLLYKSSTFTILSRTLCTFWVP